MKRKFALFNLMLMALVQLTMAYQSFHYVEHRHGHHHHHEKKEAKHFGMAAHDHSDHDDDCAVCNFHFDFFVAPQEFCLTLHFGHTTIPYSFNATEGTAHYNGSLFALRAPPALV